MHLKKKVLLLSYTDYACQTGENIDIMMMESSVVFVSMKVPGKSSELCFYMFRYPYMLKS